MWLNQTGKFSQRLQKPQPMESPGLQLYQLSTEKYYKHASFDTFLPSVNDIMSASSKFRDSYEQQETCQSNIS